MAIVIGIFKSDGDAKRAETELQHRGIGKTELSNEEGAMGGVRLTIYTPDPVADDVERVLFDGGATRIERGASTGNVGQASSEPGR